MSITKATTLFLSPQVLLLVLFVVMVVLSVVLFKKSRYVPLMGGIYGVLYGLNLMGTTSVTFGLLVVALGIGLLALAIKT